MCKKTGSLIIDNDNIFAILKQSLYTEKDIVFREIVSNAADAISKRSMHEQDNYKGCIEVILDQDNGSLHFKDNGIGMTTEEVDKYINKVAFSGATEFVNYLNETKNKPSLIGHFGIGFYSTFMLTDDVSIETLSYKKNAEPVHWECNSNMEYKINLGKRKNIGTDVILQLDKESELINNPKIIYNALKKYFLFLPVPLYFSSSSNKRILINDIIPHWRQNVENKSKEDICIFYQKMFKDPLNPLFWITFQSIDIGLRGILFFRRTNNDMNELDGTIKVYSNGVYIGDNISSIIPKYVNLQNGIIECDNLPLTASRSHIQETKEETQIFSLIYETLTQEVTIALNDLFENHRNDYEAYWPNLNPFIKYGILNDKIFASVMTKKVIFRNIKNKYQTIEEYLGTFDPTSKQIIYFSSDPYGQGHYIDLYKKEKINVLYMDHVIDLPYMQRLETIYPNLKFIRIDSSQSILFKEVDNIDQKNNKIVLNKFKTILSKRLEPLLIEVRNLKNTEIMTIIINDEKSRRIADMMNLYGIINEIDFKNFAKQAKSTLLINSSNPVISKLIEQNKITNEDDFIINYLFDLALLSGENLNINDINLFISRSEELLENYIKKE